MARFSGFTDLGIKNSRVKDIVRTMLAVVVANVDDKHDQHVRWCDCRRGQHNEHHRNGVSLMMSMQGWPAGQPKTVTCTSTKAITTVTVVPNGSSNSSTTL